MATSVTNLLWKLRGVPATEKVVLVRLGDFGREDGTSIFPAIATVAADCGLSDRAVQQVIKKHLATGVLVLISDARGGRGRTSEYAIDLNRVRELIENPEQPSPFKGNSGPSGTPARGRNTEPRSPFADQNPERHDIKGESGALNPERDSPNPLGSTKEQAAPVPRATDGEPTATAKPKAEHVAVGERIATLTGWDQSPSWFGDYGRVIAWLKAGWSPELDILPTVERLMAGRNRKGQGPPRGLDYFEAAIAEAHANRTKPLPEGESDVRQAQQRDPVRGTRPASGGRFAEILQRDLAGRA